MSTLDWEERLVRRIDETNERIAALNDALPPHVSDFYTVPTNPTPAHVDRMRSDLDELVTDHLAPGAPGVETLREHYEAVLDGLDDIHADVCRHSIPKAPNYDRR